MLAWLWNTLGLRTSDVKPRVRRSSAWPALRERWLKDHPTCAACGTWRNVEVHHIVPVHADPALELSPDNLVTLCESSTHNDHLLFGHCLLWKAWNPHVCEDAARMLSHIQGRRKS